MVFDESSTEPLFHVQNPESVRQKIIESQIDELIDKLAKIDRKLFNLRNSATMEVRDDDYDLRAPRLAERFSERQRPSKNELRLVQERERIHQEIEGLRKEMDILCIDRPVD